MMSLILICLEVRHTYTLPNTETFEQQEGWSSVTLKLNDNWFYDYEKTNVYAEMMMGLYN